MARPRLARGRCAPAGEDGFTLVELLMAITVTAVGLMALVTGFDHSRELVSVAEKTEVASHRAERQLERILAMPYASVAHPSTPAGSTDSASPAFYVNGGTYRWDQGSTVPPSETLAVDAVNGSETLSAPLNPSTWTDSETRLSGEVHSFVTWTGAFCTTADRSRCAKRVTVAVTVGGPRPLGRPVLISTVMTNPGS
jgi:prepilin-type N-terminal cleavage/methylation domain-containing protein